jgi:hypothetical protein
MSLHGLWKTERFDPDDYVDEDPENIEMERKTDIRRCAAGGASQGVVAEGERGVAPAHW